jgi:hypothetical protein
MGARHSTHSMSEGQIDLVQWRTEADQASAPPVRVQASQTGKQSMFTSDEAEIHYQPLGRWKGPDASAEAQEESRRFWLTSGRVGVRWLVNRIRDERHDDRLYGAASALADLGVTGLGLILETLRSEPTADQALALLWSLGWLGERQKTEDQLAELVLVKYLLNEDPDIRDAACRALRLLPPHRARIWLTRRLREESDHDVRRTIEEELKHVPSPQGSCHGSVEAKSAKGRAQR